ncbi:MAG: hypothetical protein M3509_10240 [Chloroflexota bacterium]|nr:hypothetical protein [Chloroflexota bacterium]
MNLAPTLNGTGPHVESEAATALASDDSASSDSGAEPAPRRVRANPARRRPRSGEPADANGVASRGDEISGTASGLPDTDSELATVAGDVASDEADAAEGPTSERKEKRLARVRQRQEAKAQRQELAKRQVESMPAISYEDGQAAHVAMLRHVNSLTVSLAEAHRIIGRLNMERYQAQRELAIAKKLPMPPPLPDPTWTKSATAGPHSVRQLQREKPDQRKPAPDPEDVARIKTAVMRRRILVLGSVALIALAIVTYRMMAWNWFPDISNRDALTQMAGIGAFIQIFFIGWMFFRFARISGKGARWLFPDVEQEHRKQVRKQQRN